MVYVLLIPGFFLLSAFFAFISAFMVKTESNQELAFIIAGFSFVFGWVSLVFSAVFALAHFLFTH